MGTSVEVFLLLSKLDYALERVISWSPHTKGEFRSRQSATDLTTGTLSPCRALPGFEPATPRT